MRYVGCLAIVLSFFLLASCSVNSRKDKFKSEDTTTISSAVEQIASQIDTFEMGLTKEEVLELPEVRGFNLIETRRDNIEIEYEISDYTTFANVDLDLTFVFFYNLKIGEDYRTFDEPRLAIFRYANDGIDYAKHEALYKRVIELYGEPAQKESHTNDMSEIDFIGAIWDQEGYIIQYTFNAVEEEYKYLKISYKINEETRNKFEEYAK